MDERLERRALRRSMGKYGWALLLYYLLMNVCVSVFMEMDVIRQGLEAVIRTNRWEQFYNGIDPEALMGNGWGYIFASCTGVLLALLWTGKDGFCEIWKTKKIMTPGSFFALVCIFVSVQFVFQFCATFQEWVLNHFGLSVMESLEMASGYSDTLSMFLYGTLVAPVVEEILFRGVILRGLMPQGRRFAVVASAALFGLFHGNIVQIPYAFVAGLVLGYVAVEYSVLWSMVLHMINNLVLGDTLTRLTAGLSVEMQSVVIFLVILVCSIAALVVLLRRRKEVWAYHQAYRISWNQWAAFATAPGIIVLFVLMYAGAFFMLS